MEIIRAPVRQHTTKTILDETLSIYKHLAIFPGAKKEKLTLFIKNFKKIFS
jgi:hypothetical protein